MQKFNVGDRVIFEDPEYFSPGIAPGDRGTVTRVCYEDEDGTCYQCLPDIDPYPENPGHLWAFLGSELELEEVL